MSDCTMYWTITVYFKNNNTYGEEHHVDSDINNGVYLSFHEGFVEVYDKWRSSWLFPKESIKSISTSPWPDRR